MNRWENSLLWTRNFAPPLTAGVPQVQAFDIPIATALNMGPAGAPVTLVKAIPGFFILPFFGEFIRNGDPFATAPGNLRISYSLNGTAALEFTNTALTAASVPGTFISAIAGMVGTLNARTTDGSPNLAGDLVARFLTGSPTISAASAGSIITLLVTYFFVPTYPQTVGPRSPLS